MNIKIISLWQPWATFMALELKRYETRSWSTAYRGPLGIHAAKRKLDREARAIFYSPIFYPTLQEHGYHAPDDLPFGRLLAVADLVEIYPTGQVRGYISFTELAAGNYQPGRFAWLTTGITRLPDPIPLVGRQGLWTYNLPEEALPHNRLNGILAKGRSPGR